MHVCECEVFHVVCMCMCVWHGVLMCMCHVGCMCVGVCHVGYMCVVSIMPNACVCVSCGCKSCSRHVCVVGHVQDMCV